MNKLIKLWRCSSRVIFRSNKFEPIKLLPKVRSWTNIANKKLQQKLERNQEIKLWTNLKKCLTKSKRKSYISGPTIILIFSFKYISQKVAFRRRQISLQIFLIFNNKTLLWQNTGSARYFYELFLCCFMLFNVLREGLPS